MKDLKIGELNYYRQALAEFSRRSFDRHLIGGTGGNLSVRIPHTDRVLITPTGISLGDVKPEENILVSLTGEVLESPMGLKGSKETSFHLAAFRSRPDVGAIAHVHPPYATAFSNACRPLPLATVQARLTFKHVPCVECFPPGSKELCDCVTDGIKLNPDTKALLMKEHGIMTLGTDLMNAFYLADLLEDTAKIAYLAANIQNR
jgi:L-ribulose-5-phosphate 4-epimerase